ncbi:MULTISPECIES: hypothetical protein [Ochrobactrum]|uniref:Uncharacterized protein n=1 Tax=Ochrobactrum quorumnocens TaxID=271865 RepID=A0A5N1JWP0_9HYPH|nr:MULTISPECIES: hypothetical protein [Brucella/Ochrobactrum group]KAA9368293.1 hypothetical protein F3W84_10410 [[Ochrobactrum] quorumnocens]MBD7991805.1 hypothetical protein [Ochrobactrum gallinarum]MDH7792493.1 hypothetical protein [Ochrobactrum sp. AN78]
MSVKSDKQGDTRGKAPRLFRYIPRLVLLLLAVLIVIFLAWSFLGGASVSSTRFIQSKPGAAAPSRPVEQAPGHNGSQQTGTAGDQPAASALSR